MSIKIDQALIQAYITGAFGLTIAHENADFTPTAGTPYAELVVFRNEAAPDTQGSTAGKDETTGIFQVALRYPVGAYSGAAKTLADSIMAYFLINREFTYSGQVVQIVKKDRGSGRVEDGWYKLVLRFFYTARTARNEA